MSTSYLSGRRHERAGVDVFINKIIGDEPHMARARDISAGGLYMYKLLEPTIADNTRVGLELMLPGSKEVIWAVGRVVRKEADDLADGVAIRFTRIAEADRQAIRDYVNRIKIEAATQPTAA